MDPVWVDLLNHIDDVPANIRAWALDLWDDIGVGQARPSHMLRSVGPTIALGTAFQGGARTAARRKRELHHQVRGVLSKASPENYDKVQADLLALPIRQSDGEEIDKVVQVFFVKATDPSERLYAGFYARSFKALLDHIRDEESKRGVDLTSPEVSAYRRLKKSLLAKLQALYNSSDVLDEIKHGDSMSDEQRTQKLSEFKANISFLGELFLVDLVQEKLVSHVLYHLLFPNDGDSSELPKDYEVDQFYALLRVVGPRTTEKGVRSYTKSYLDRCEILITDHPVKRCQFKSMDLRDMINAGFMDKNSKGAMSKEDISKAEFKTAIARAEQRHTTPTIPAPASRSSEPAGMTADMFLKCAIAPSAFGDDESQFFGTVRGLAPAVAESFFENMISQFLKSTDKAIKADQRKTLGKLCAQFVDKGLYTRERVESMINRVLVKFVEDDMITDCPKCVEYLIEIVTASRQLVPNSLFGFGNYLTFLSAMMATEHDKTGEVLRRLVDDVELSSERQIQEATNWDTRSRFRRFRLLPVLLRCTHSDADFVDEYAKKATATTRDVSLFGSLMLSDVSIPLWSKDFKVIIDPKLYLPPNHVDDYWRIQFVSALFVFVRFDSNLLDKFYVAFKKIFDSADFKRQMPLLLVEVYETWVDLGRTPKGSLLDFLGKLQLSRTSYGQLLRYVREIVRDEEVASLLSKLS